MSRRKHLWSLLLLVISFAVANCYRRGGSPEFDLHRPGRGRQGTERDFHPNATSSLTCSSCSCDQTPQCPPGVSLLQDGCNCCKMCARQLGQDCDELNVCDRHKRLYCSSRDRTCKASPGKKCSLGGKVYENGALITMGCKATCFCIDGSLGCVPMCTSTPSKTRACRHPRLLRRKGECCPQWVCISGSIMSQYERVHHEQKAPERIDVIYRGTCMVQTSKWSECSKSCGFGYSERITNDNKNCKFEKQMRLCEMRPCSVVEKASLSPRKGKCRKNPRRRKRVRFSLSGCLSTRTYRPRYCNVCGDRCCKPVKDRTAKITFACKDGPSNATSTTFSRDMMLIKKCECNQPCRRSPEIFSLDFGFGIGSDTWRPA